MRTITAFSALLPVSRLFRPLIHILVCLMLSQTLLLAADDWKVLPIRSESEFNQGLTGGEGMQLPHGITRCVSDPNYIYWNHDNAGPWVSTNAGASWKKCVSKGLYQNNADSICVDPVNPRTVFAVLSHLWYPQDSEFDGLYKSTDAGENWTLVLQTNCGFDWYKHRYIKSNIAYDPATKESNRTKVWYATFHSNGLYKSSDYGNTWSLLANSSVDKFYSLAVGDSNRVYIGTDDGFFLYTPETASINAFGDLPSGAVTSVFVNPTDSNIILTTVYGVGLYKSTNKGTNFTQIKSLNVWAGFYNSGYPDTIYLCDSAWATHPCYYTHDGGQTWFQGTGIQPYGLQSGLVPNAKDPNEAVMFAFAEIYKTTNGGSTFSLSSTLFTGYCVVMESSFAFDQFDPNRFALGLADVAYMLTTNGGNWFSKDMNNNTGGIVQNWGTLGYLTASVASSPYFPCIDFKPVQGSGTMAASVGYTPYSSANARLIYYANQNTHWALDANFDPGNPASYRQILFLQYHRTDSNTVYSSQQKSTDSGVSYQDVNFAPYTTYSDAMIYGQCLSHPDVIYATYQYNQKLLRSADRGVTWTQVTYPGWKFNMMTGIPTIAIDPCDPNLVYSINANGDIASYNVTTNRWTSLGLLAQVSRPATMYSYVSHIAIDPRYNNIIYAVVNGAGISNVWRSTNSGSTWEDISNNLPRNGNFILAVSPHTGELFAGGLTGTYVLPPPYASTNLFYNHSASLSDSNSTYTLSITATNGSVTKTPDKASYNSGETVTLQATPNTGYDFANWSGDASGTNNPVTITMNSNKSVTANFAVHTPTTYTLNITATNGSVTKTPDKTSYNSGETVTLQATPNTGYDFANWSGDASGTNSSVTITMNSNKSVTANFAAHTPTTYTLSITATNGSVTKTPDKASYNSGETVTLQATPNTGYNFVNWSGDASGTNSSVTITMNSNKSVTASFVINTYTLSITATNGSVTKTPDKTSYNSGETVTIQAVPNTRYAFTNWSGNTSGSSNPVTITMNTNKSVTANFNAIVDNDNTAPSVTGLSPAADSIQMPLDRLVILHVADDGEGVDANSVTIKVNDNMVYTGDTADYNSSYGRCHRTGAKADYTFIYQPHAAFDYDQKVSVVVNAQDLAGNAMSQYSYSFLTETRSFGENKMVNSSSKNLGKGHPATVRDSAGNIWVAWHAGAVSSSGMRRGIYVGKLPAGADNFGISVREATNASDRCNAALAIDAYDKLYLAWQDNQRKKWDIYMSTSVDGINWSTEIRVTDSDSNAVNPVIAVDHSLPPKAYIAWQDDRAGNQEIYIASSSDGFATKTISGITSDNSDHIKPAIAVDSANTVYVVWADSRNGSSDIYGAASNNGPWANVPIVTKPGNQTNPAIATEATGSILHLLWVDDTAGNKDIYYAASNGLPETSLAGRNIVDDNSGADQLTPMIITTGSTSAGLRVFACWQDMRNIVKSGGTDLYFVEVNHGRETNILVGNNATSSNQSAPVIGVDRYGYPYLVWADDRNQNTDIYYAGSTFVHSNVLASQNISPASDSIIGTEPANITGVNDVSVVVPAGAYPCELNITISKVENPPKLPVSLFNFPYEFGPSGVNFSQPVTITIPYSVSAPNNPAFAYWYNTLVDALSQQGITNVETIAIYPTLYALRFKTTHFTQFIVGGSVSSSIQVAKCIIIAGSKDNSDKISISGKMDATADNFNDATVIEVTVDSNDMVNPCVLTFPVNSNTLKKNKYSYSGTENGVKKSFKYDVKTHSFASAANNVNLSGLDCPLTFDINVGDYIGTAEVNETIVNGKNKPIPITLLMGVKYSLRVDKCLVKPGNKKPNTDQLAVRGSFTVKDTDVDMTNRVNEGLVVTLGTQTFTIPTNELNTGNGKFTCSKAEVTEGGTAMVSFDFNNCSFMLTIKNTNITASSGTVDFGVAFAGYSQIRQVTLL